MRTILGMVLWVALSFAADLPRKAPALNATMPDGSKLTLAKCAGKVCVVEFLFTTCPHCQQTSMVLSKLYQEYGSRGFQPLGAAFNEGATMLVPQFVRDFRVNYPVGIAGRADVFAFLGYPITARIMVPQVVIIDRKGMVRYQSSLNGSDDLHSEANLRRRIEELLNEKATASRK